MEEPDRTADQRNHERRRSVLTDEQSIHMHRTFRSIHIKALLQLQTDATGHQHVFRRNEHRTRELPGLLLCPRVREQQVSTHHQSNIESTRNVAATADLNDGRHLGGSNTIDRSGDAADRADRHGSTAVE